MNKRGAHMNKRGAHMNKRTARLLAAGLLAAGLLAATSAVGSVTPIANAQSSKSSTKRVSIVIVSPFYSQQPATKEVVDNFVANAKAKGWTTRIVDTKSDDAKTITELRSAASRKATAIVLGMGEVAKMGPGLAAAKKAKIPVFGLDAGVADGVTANVTTDNKVLGEQAAEAMTKAIGGKGSVLMFTFDDFEPVKIRGRAAEAYFKSKGITVLEYHRIEALAEGAEGGVATAKKDGKDLLAKYGKGEVNGIWCAWDNCAKGADQAVNELGRTELSVTGVDGQDFAVAEIQKKGTWKATVKQDWKAIADKATALVEAQVKTGKSADTGQVFVPSVVIDSTNVTKFAKAA
jgi:ribose transport system substrate-binding protein